MQDRTYHIGLLDTRCILHICNKGKEGEGRVFDSISAIGDAVFSQLAAAYGIDMHQLGWDCAAPASLPALQRVQRLWST